MYFWSFGRTDDNKPILFGPFISQEEAQREADKLHDATVFRLSTRDRVRATRSIKGMLGKQMSKLEPALERFKHPNGTSTPGNVLLGKEDIFTGDPFRE